MNRAACKTADTLEELAEKLCVRDVDAFIATIERYNELADLGVDEDFGKPAYQSLSHIVEPPFYGAMMMGNLLCTLDGLRINADMQVLDTNGNPIPGLYAAGNDSGGFFSGNYPEAPRRRRGRPQHHVRSSCGEERGRASIKTVGMTGSIKL